MALPVTITGINTTVASVGPFKSSKNTAVSITPGSVSLTPIGDNAGNTRASQTFTWTDNGALTAVTLKLVKLGSPTDNVQVYIYATSAQKPTTLLGTSNTVLSGSTVTTSEALYEFTFSPAVTLTNGVQYAVAVGRSGAVNGSNFFRWTNAASDLVPAEKNSSYDGSVWATPGVVDCYVIATSNAGAYYLFGRDSTTSTTLQAFKATAPDTSWASIATKTGFTTAIQFISAYQVGDVIHMVITDGTGTSINHKYQTFSMTTDTFVTAETINSALNTQTSTSTNSYMTSIVVRSTAEVVVHYNTTRISTFSQTAYRRRTGVSTWAAGVAVSTTGVNTYSPMVVLGASDRLHFLWYNSTNMIQRHLTSANVLGTAASTGAGVLQDIATLTAATPNFVGVGASWAARWSSADNPTVTTAGIAFGQPVRIADINGIFYALYRGSADSDLYIKQSTDNGAAWDAGTNVFTGTVALADNTLSLNQLIYTRGALTVFPYIVNDNGTLKYNEYTISGGVTHYTMPAATGAVALTGRAAALSYFSLPVTITGLSTALPPNGPFKSLGGNYYIFGRDATTATTLQAYKDAGGGFSSVATKTGFSTAINFVSAYQVGNIIHMVITDGPSTSSVNHTYQTFDCSTDTFVTNELINSAIDSRSSSNSAQYATNIVVRSTGEVVVLYNAARISTFAQIAYRNRTGVATWATEVVVSTGGTNCSVPFIALGASDRLHFTWYNNSVTQHRHLTSVNVLGTTTSTGATNAAGDVASYDAGGGTVYLVGSCNSFAVRWTSADDPTISTTSVTFAFGNRLVASNVGGFYVLYVNSGDSDLYIKSSSDNGANWGSAVKTFTGTASISDATLSRDQVVYTRGNSLVFPYVVNDGGTLKYSEYTISTTGVTNYTMPAATGAIVLAGVANKLARSYDFNINVGAVALTGIDVTLTKTTAVVNYPMPAATGAVVLGGVATILIATRKLPITVGAVVLGGVVTGLRAARFVRATVTTYTLAGSVAGGLRTMAALVGARTLTGFDTKLVYGRKFPITVGNIVFGGVVTGLRAARFIRATVTSYTLTGIDVTLSRTTALTHYTMPATVGTITLNGQTVTLKRNYVVPHIVGALTLGGVAVALRATRFVRATATPYILTGVATGTLFGHKLTAVTGAFTLTGVATGLRYAHNLPVSVGTFLLNGQPASLVYGSARVMPASTGSVVLAGPTTRLVYARKFPIAAGAVTLAGVAATLRYNHVLPVSVGPLILSGIATALRTARVLPVTKGSFTLNGQSVSFRYTRVMPVTAGSFVLNGLAANLIFSNNPAKVLPATVGAITLGGVAATLKRTYALKAVVGAYTLNGVAATLRYAHRVVVTAGAFTLNGQTVTLKRNYAAVNTVGTFVLNGPPTGLAVGRKIVTTVGTFLLNGVPVAFRRTNVGASATGAIVLNGVAVTLTYTQTGPIANAWDKTNKSATVTLTNGDRTATTSTTAGQGAKSTQKRLYATAGKYYAEFVCDIRGSSDWACGISRVALDLTGGAIVDGAGNIKINNVFQTGIGSLSNNDVISIAYDSGGNLFWARKNNGVWNNSGTANPATGVGGFDTSFLAGSGDVPLSFYGLLSNTQATVRTQTAMFTQTLFSVSSFKSWMNETLAIAYTMPAATGTVTLAGPTTVLRAARRMTASVGAVTLAGTATGLRYDHLGATATGAIVLNRLPAALRYARVMAAVNGSFTLNGQTTLLRRGRVVVTSSGAIILNGIPVNLVYHATSGVNVWNGTGWVDKPAKVWTGSAWMIKPVKTWNGSAWV